MIPLLQRSDSGFNLSVMFSKHFKQLTELRRIIRALVTPCNCVCGYHYLVTDTVDIDPGQVTEQSPLLPCSPSSVCLISRNKANPSACPKLPPSWEIWVSYAFVHPICCSFVRILGIIICLAFKPKSLPDLSCERACRKEKSIAPRS